MRKFSEYGGRRELTSEEAFVSQPGPIEAGS